MRFDRNRSLRRLRTDPRIRATIDLFSLFAGRIGGIVVTLLFIPRYHMLLGGEVFGAVSIVLSLQAFFLVSDLGLATLISRDTAIAREDASALTVVVWMRRRAEAILAAITLVIVIGALVIPLSPRTSVSWSFTSGVNVAMVAPLIMALVATNIVQLSLNALGDYRASAITAVVGALARGGATVVVLTAYPTLSMFLQVQLVMAIAYLLLVRWYLERRCGPVRTKERLFRRDAIASLLKRCVPLTIYTLASAAAVNLDKVIVSSFISVEAAGTYFLATTYSLVPVAVLSGPINSYFAPRVAHARHAGDLDDERRLATLFQTVLMCAVIGPSLSLAFQAPAWLLLWLHNLPQGILTIAPILLAGGGLSATGYYPTTYLIAAGENGYLARLSLACGVAVMAAAFFFASRNDLKGFAWSYFAFYAVGFAGLWLRLGALTGWRRLARFLMGSYVFPAIAIGASFFVAHALSRGLAPVVELLLPLTAAAAISMVILAAVFWRESHGQKRQAH